MAYNISFTKSGSPDVVGYRLFYSLDSATLSSDSSYIDLDGLEETDGVLSMDLATLPEFKALDGDYFLGISAVDDAGLTSTMLKYPSALQIDFIPPDPPTNLVIQIS